MSKGLAKSEGVGSSRPCCTSKGLAKLEGVGYSRPCCTSKGLAKLEGTMGRTMAIFKLKICQIMAIGNLNKHMVSR
jgi:hypothetical protein